MKKIMLLVCSFVTAASFATGAFASPLPDAPHIYVEGSAELEVVPDQMTITVGLSATNPQIGVAKAEVDERSTQLIDACKKVGIASEDLATTALHVSPAYEYRSGEQVNLGTRVYREVDITLKDLEKYPDLMAALIKSEISNTVSTRLEVSNEKALADKALVAAIEDARVRAESMAKPLGKKVGGAHSVSEFNIRSDERHQLFTVRGIEGQGARESDAMQMRSAKEPFEPGLMTAKAQVYVVFLIR